MWVYMLRISKTIIIMGACNSYLSPPLLPAAARERLGNQPYTKWKTFAHDLLLGHGGATRIKFTIELELLLICANGTHLTIISPMTFDDYVHTSTLCYYAMLIRVFMGAPHRFDIDHCLYFYENVRYCKLTYIKNFVLQ